jgi:hypothetical protein
MRQSGKQKAVVSPENQLLHAAFSEALSRSSLLGEVEISCEFASVQEKLKNVPKKSYR